MNTDNSWYNTDWYWSKKDCILCGKQCDSIYGCICDNCLHRNKHRKSWLDSIIDGILKLVGCGAKWWQRG